MKHIITKILFLAVLTSASSLAREAKAANTFFYGANEVELYRTTFGTDFNIDQGWDLTNTTIVNNGVLKASQDNWSRAFYDFDYDLDSGPLNIYWSMNTNKSTNERSKVYLELNFTNDPNLIEQRHIAFNVRPANDNRPYQIYLDPAFCPDPNTCPPEDRDQLLQNIVAPTELFTNSTMFESLRLRVRKLPNNPKVIQAIPFYRYNNIWNRFYKDTAKTLPVALNINTNNFSYLRNVDYFQSVSWLFRSNVSALDAIAFTRTNLATARTTLALEESEGDLLMEKVPESNLMLGLLGAIALKLKLRTKINLAIKK